MALEILTIIVLSMLPIFELRGGIPFGIAVTNLSPLAVYLLAVIANILVIPIVFLFLDYLHHRLMLIQIYAKIFGKFIERTKHKAHGHISKYGYLGLMLFVAIPLPITGAYTGTIAAWFFDMERKKAMIALASGVIISGVIVTLVTLTGVGASVFITDRLSN